MFNRWLTELSESIEMKFVLASANAPEKSMEIKNIATVTKPNKLPSRSNKKRLAILNGSVCLVFVTGTAR